MLNQHEQTPYIAIDTDCATWHMPAEALSHPTSLSHINQQEREISAQITNSQLHQSHQPLNKSIIWNCVMQPMKGKKTTTYLLRVTTGNNIHLLMQ
jgi:hypothetical protein